MHNEIYKLKERLKICQEDLANERKKVKEKD